ncbi:MAG: Cof-type HAD-IIB family hydrolase [Erysipelotrichaceae bacterium]
MDKYAVFVDADGTLINSKGMIPQSAFNALKEVKKNGHYIFLSTGRSLAELNKTILDIGFDGIIASGGAYASYKEKVLRNLVFEQADIDELLEYSIRNNLAISFECAHGLYVTEIYMNTMIESVQDSELFENPELYDFRNIFIPIKEDTVIHDVSKVSFMCLQKQFYEIKNSFSKKYDIIDSSLTEMGMDLTHGEIALKDIHKGSAIILILEELKEEVKTIGLGDSENDVEMLRFCDIGIAMGNASNVCKSAADEITASVNDDGLYKALKAHNLF